MFIFYINYLPADIKWNIYMYTIDGRRKRYVFMYYLLLDYSANNIRHDIASDIPLWNYYCLPAIEFYYLVVYYHYQWHCLYHYSCISYLCN